MSGGSKPSSTTTTQTNEPPSYVQPFLQGAASEANRMYLDYKNWPQYYAGETVTPFSSQTQQALDLTQQRALSGSPVSTAAKGYVANTLNTAPTSKFGGATPFGNVNNPYLDAQFNRAADQVQNRIQTGFAGDGRNIEAGRPVAALELNDLASNIYGGAYENERNRGLSAYEGERNRMASDLSQQRGMQLSAAGLAPQLAAQDYADLGALQGVGGAYDDLRSRQIADDVSRHDFAQNSWGTALDQYIARLNNQPGGSSSSTTPYFTNRGAGILGGASMGYGLGSQFGQNMGGGYWGMVGAGLGGLLGGYA
jgi:hypothetical protein